MDKPEHGEDINALPKRLKLVVSLDTQPPPAVLQLFDILHDVSLLSKSRMILNYIPQNDNGVVKTHTKKFDKNQCTVK